MIRSISSIRISSKASVRRSGILCSILYLLWSIPLLGGSQFQNGLCAVAQKGRWGFIDKKGKLSLPFVWERVGWAVGGEGFQEGYAAVMRGGKWNYINVAGKAAFGGTWDDAKSFSEGLAAVKTSGKWGYIDTKGDLLVPTEWDSAGPFSEGFACVARGKDRFYIDRNGTVVFPQSGETFHEGLAAIKATKNFFGFMDRSGEIVIPAEWHGVGSFGEGLAPVRRDDKPDHWKFLDRQGKVAFSIEGSHFHTPTFHEGRALIVRGAGSGFCDTKGVLVIPPEWDRAYAFSEGMACVLREGKSGFIDKSGKICVPLEWDIPHGGSFFSEGMAMVVRGNEIGFVDKQGRLVIALFDQDSDPNEWKK